MAMKQLRAQVLLEGAHLVAHGAVREVQLVGRLGEALQARGRLEGAQRGERRQALGHL